MAESFAARLALRIPETEKRLWAEAEENVIRAYANPLGDRSVDVGWRKHANKRLDEEKKLQERIEHEEWAEKLSAAILAANP